MHFQLFMGKVQIWTGYYDIKILFKDIGIPIEKIRQPQKNVYLQPP